jgi:hypothetical protein
MKKTILAATILGLVSVVTPRPAPAQLGIDVEKPGLSLHVGPPVYGPPVVVAPPPPAVVYQPPAYYVAPPPKHYWKHWKHWDKHWHRHHHGDWD